MADPAPRLSQLLAPALASRPEAVAIEADGRRVTYRELEALAGRLATALADAGLAGERVATLLPNSVELVAGYLACWKAGAIAVPFEYVDAPPEVAYGLADSGARWLLVHEEKLGDLAKVDLRAAALREVIVVGSPSGGRRCLSDLLAAAPRPLPAPPDDALAFILYTSGSTALPKGVTHSHASAAGIVTSVLDALSRVGPDARIVAHDSVSHMGGWIETFPLLFRGASVSLVRAFEAERFRSDLLRVRPTVVGAHVDHLWQMLRHPALRREDFASVDTVFTGGDELPLALQQAFLDRTGLPIQAGWGMTEAIWLTLCREPELVRRGRLGRPVAGVELRVADLRSDRFGRALPDGEVGELWVRGPMVTPGYWRRPEADREMRVEGGWFRTGDMGFRDADGEYWFTGRRKQIIERSSENITPGEIEQALARHPAVAEAGAFGVADPDEGQVPVAYVAFAPGRAATEAELKTFLATQIAAFKIPARILPIERIPRTHSGKIDHTALAARHASGAA